MRPCSRRTTRRRIRSTTAWLWVATTHGRALEVDALQQFHDLGRVRRIEIPGRLVAQQDLRVADQRPRDRGALLFAARELAREHPALVREPDEIEHARHLRITSLVRVAGDLQRERDVFPDRLVREQLEVLEHDADVAAQLRRLCRGAACRRGCRRRRLRRASGQLFTVQQLEQTRFPGPRMADEKDEIRPSRSRDRRRPARAYRWDTRATRREV